jgi:hypothetical protein
MLSHNNIFQNTTGFSNLPILSSRTTAPVLTQPLTEIKTTTIPRGEGGWAVCA